MKRFSINSGSRMSGRSLFAQTLSFPTAVFSSSLSFFQSLFLTALFLYRHLPMSTHLQGTNIWEMQFEHFSGTKGRQTMLEKWGDKHIAELMLDKHVALPSIHKWPCHVQRSQVWKSKDKLDGARGRCCFWVCLLAELVSLLFGRFSPWGMSSVKMTAERWLFLRDKTRGNTLHQTLSPQRKISAWRRRRHRLFHFKGPFSCETSRLLGALAPASAALGPLGASLLRLLILTWFQGQNRVAPAAKTLSQQPLALARRTCAGRCSTESSGTNGGKRNCWRHAVASRQTLKERRWGV